MLPIASIVKHTFLRTSLPPWLLKAACHFRTRRVRVSFIRTDPLTLSLNHAHIHIYPRSTSVVYTQSRTLHSPTFADSPKIATVNNQKRGDGMEKNTGALDMKTINAISMWVGVTCRCCCCVAGKQSALSLFFCSHFLCLFYPLTQMPLRWKSWITKSVWLKDKRRTQEHSVWLKQTPSVRLCSLAPLPPLLLSAHLLLLSHISSPRHSRSLTDAPKVGVVNNEKRLADGQEKNTGALDMAHSNALSMWTQFFLIFFVIDYDNI